MERRELKFERLTQLSLSLLRESTLERLVQRFVSIQKEDFGLIAASVINFNLDVTPLSWESAQHKVEGVSDIDVSLVDELCSKILLTNFKNSDYKQGVSTFSVQGVGYWCLFVTDSMMLVWTADLSQRQLEHVDFLASQVQVCSRWFAKLDKTQSKLYVDDLTGLYNMRYFDILLDAEIRRSQRFKTEFCLLFIDLDGFKAVNDQHGHASGSGVLKQMAYVLRATLREVDSVVRYGGDEFVVLLLGASSSMGYLAGERIRKQIEKYNFKTDMGTNIKLTASIGVAAHPSSISSNIINKEDLLKIADEAMYRSKRSGKNKVVLCSSSEADL